MPLKYITLKHLFYLGFLIKIPLILFVDSSITEELFIPFLRVSLANPLENPWAVLPPSFFPYGTFLLAVFWLPAKFLGFFISPQLLLSTKVLMVLIKSILLIFDVLLFYVLNLFDKNVYRKHILTFYWLNPIAIYISYIHGQLDIIFITLVISAIYFLIKDRVFLFALLFSASVLSKFSSTILFPFLLAYIWNQNFIKQAVLKIATCLSLVGILVLVGFWPLINSGKLGYATFASPQALQVFALQESLSNNLSVFFGIVFLLIGIERLCLATKITDKGLVFGCGYLFLIVLCITVPGPGWFMWVIPFIALFYAHYRMVPYPIYIALIADYFLHFSIGSELPSFWASLSLTILITLTVSIVALFELVCLRYEVTLFDRLKPLKIAIAGDSGSGKNFFTNILINIFNSNRVIVIEGDDYHKWERGNTNWQEVTHLNPEANNLSKFSTHLKSIANGTPIHHHHYDHQTGMFTEQREIKPSKAVIYQGLHTLFLKGLREEAKLKIFLSPDPRVRLAWKIKRDVKERGYSPEKVLEQLRKREEDSKAYIQPQQEFADWIIRYKPLDETITEEDVLKNESVEIALQYTFWNDLYIEDLVDELVNTTQCKMQFQTEENLSFRKSITLYGNPTSHEIKQIVYRLFPHLRHITRGWFEPEWMSGYDGINQLFFLKMLEESKERN